MDHSRLFVQRTSNAPSKRANGYSMILFLALLPLLLTLFAGFAGLQLSIGMQSKSHNLCRMNALKAQHYMSEKLKELLKLNPKAKSLRVQMKSAKKLLLAALASLNSIAIAVARLNVWRVRLQQIVLAGKQQIILNAARLKSIQLKSNLKKSIEQAGVTHAYVSFSNGLAVYPTPIASLSPSYKTQFDFKNRQSIQAKWNTSISSVLPPWIRNSFKMDRPLIGSCGATLIKRRSRWTPTLIEAKYSSN